MSQDRTQTIGVLLRHVADKGGIAVYSRNLLDEMLARASDLRFVLVYADRSAMGRYASRANVLEVLVPLPRLPGGVVIWDQVLALRAMRRHGVGVVFNPKLSVPFFTRRKTVFPMHGLEQFAAPECFRWYDRVYTRLLSPLYCRKADAIVCPTKVGREALQRYLNVPPARIHVIPDSYNGDCRVISDRGRLDSVRQRLGLPDSFILFVGGITPLKNVPALVRAVHALKQRGLEHRLVLVGFRRWKHENEVRLVEELGLRHDVREIGFVSDEDLPALYNLASCFVLPSFYEGFGLPVVEAQACGCPVVISNVPALVEVAGGAALIADPRRPDELADRIAAVLTDASLRSRLVAAGIENAKRFSWRRTADQTLDLLRSLSGAQAQSF